MTLGGLAVITVFMGAVLLLALVVVLAAAWSSLEQRRGGADRLGRLLHAAMTRVEHVLVRGRRALAERGERLVPLLARALDGAAHRVQSLADRLGARGRPADDEAAGADVRGAEADVRHAAAEPVAPTPGRGATVPRGGGRRGRPSPSSSREADADAAGAPARDGDRLPSSFRDRLAG